MISFLDFILERQLQLNKQAYPKYNNILVLAGGGGSGKGFVLNNVISFEGKTFDVDEMKKQIIKLGKLGGKWETQFKKKYGRSLSSIDMKNPEDTSIIHMFAKETGLEMNSKNIFFKAAANSNHKPNVIFDCTLKSYSDIEEIAKFAKIGGYKKENIHLVYVVNEWDTIIKQNAQRERSISPELLQKTFRGAAETIVKMLKKNCRKFDGDVWVVFNKAEEMSKEFWDSFNWKSNKPANKDAEKFSNSDSVALTTASGESIIAKYNAVKLKSAGQDFISADEFLKTQYAQKLIGYVGNFVKEILKND